MSLLRNNFYLAFFLTLFILIPDILANYKWENYAHYDFITFLLALFFTFSLSFALTFTHKVLLIFITVFFLSMGFVQVLHFDFFYSFMHDYDWSLIVEAEDIFASLESIYMYVIFISILMVSLFFSLYFLLRMLRLEQKKYAYFSLFVILLIFIIFSLIQKQNLPHKKYFSYINSTSTLLLAVIHSLTPKQHHHFKAYSVKKEIKSEKPIVIVIMGESLNAKKMHLYNFDMNNTPLLDTLQKDKNFHASIAISGGVNTAISLPTFFYTKREPENQNLIKTNTTNLMQLAKNSGYTTYWLSTQQDKDYAVLAPIFSATDILKTKPDWDEPLYDDVLLKYLHSVDFSKKTFLVLHLRVNHSPYEKYIPKKYYKWNYKNTNYPQYKFYSYMDSILYADYIVASIINYMKQNHKHFTLYFTSDHGEMLGTKEEQYQYGHSRLTFACAQVPFIYYSDVYNRKIYKKYTHYLISKMIAKDLGYTIINPNEDQHYFLNGVGANGEWGYLPYTLTQNQKMEKER